MIGVDLIEQPGNMIAGFQRLVPVKVQFGHDAQFHAGGDAAPQEAARVFQPGQHAVTRRLTLQRTDKHGRVMQIGRDGRVRDRDQSQTRIIYFVFDEFADFVAESARPRVVVDGWSCLNLLNLLHGEALDQVALVQFREVRYADAAFKAGLDFLHVFLQMLQR